ncbi:MAG: hypothetical protein QW568_00590 [Candidatus Anstonellaceae archaeon]
MLYPEDLKRAVAAALAVLHLATGIALQFRGAIKSFEQRLQAKLVAALSGTKCDSAGKHSHTLDVEALSRLANGEPITVVRPGLLLTLRPYVFPGSPKCTDSLLQIRKTSFTELASRYTIGAKASFSFDGYEIELSENFAVARVFEAEGKVSFLSLPYNVSRFRVLDEYNREKNISSEWTLQLANHAMLVCVEQAIASQKTVQGKGNGAPEPSDSLRQFRQGAPSEQKLALPTVSIPAAFSAPSFRTAIGSKNSWLARRNPAPTQPPKLCLARNKC